ncbi:TIGR02206 family membrane protein [Nocardioides aurantiacus]|uniref:Putative integral membrane protein (TIGR02206 family) n=1 Tax=Nocardioides aurantiacus TaxID=86796 RepID=A0A3N2CX65_9ACTN|nr:TIGR02206 family membrane protein [Nocardioides aurantiacus]ROR92130.1 putative integral membrane protein (TIGR02206 family) [Nocardioides aurantiacus]
MDPADARFQAFGPDHLAWLVVCLVGCAGAVWLGRRLRARGVEPSFRRAVAVLLVVTTVPLQVLQLLPGDFRLGTSLPLQICDLAWMLAAWALWTGRRRPAQVLLLWGVTLVPQAVLTPALVETFPDPRYLMFWSMHLLTIWSAVHLGATGQGRPSWRGLRVAVAATLAWVVSVMVLNAAIGTNYGYLNGKPSGGSLLDLLGPWPAYVVAEVGVVLVVWTVVTAAVAGCRPRGGRVPEGAAVVPHPR